MKSPTISKRSNAYRAGYARTRKRYHSLADNPYRTGTHQWHEWRAGFEDAIQAFVAEVTGSAKGKSSGAADPNLV